MRLGYGVELRQGSKHNKIKRDIQRREKAKKYELKNLYIKYMQKEGEKNIMYNAEEMTKNSYIKIRNRCVYTGKARGVYRKYKMSRVSFRELCINGELPGFRKGSW